LGVSKFYSKYKHLRVGPTLDLSKKSSASFPAARSVSAVCPAAHKALARRRNNASARVKDKELAADARMKEKGGADAGERW
jgi:hypothetical protein